jgi:hypothetical protein
MRKEVYFLLIWIIISNVLVIVDGQVEEDIESISVIFVDGVVGQVPKDVGIYEFLREPFLDDGLPDRAMLYSELGLSYGDRLFDVVVVECFIECDINEGEISLNFGEYFLTGSVDYVTEIQNTFDVREFTDSMSFIRGDANKDGKIDISDGIFILNFLFLGGPRPIKPTDRADVNDDNRVDISDGVGLLTYLFRGGPEPLAPFPDPGIDGEDPIDGIEEVIPYYWTEEDVGKMFEFGTSEVSVLGDINSDGITDYNDLTILEEKIDNPNLEVSCASSANIIFNENDNDVLDNDDYLAYEEFNLLGGDTHYLYNNIKSDCQSSGFPVSTRLSGFPGESIPIIVHGGFSIETIDVIEGNGNFLIRMDEESGIIFIDILYDTPLETSILLLLGKRGVFYYLQIYIDDGIDFSELVDEDIEPDREENSDTNYCTSEGNYCCLFKGDYWSEELLDEFDTLASIDEVEQFLSDNGDISPVCSNGPCSNEGAGGIIWVESSIDVCTRLLSASEMGDGRDIELLQAEGEGISPVRDDDDQISRNQKACCEVTCNVNSDNIKTCATTTKDECKTSEVWDNVWVTLRDSTSDTSFDYSVKVDTANHVCREVFKDDTASVNSVKFDENRKCELGEGENAIPKCVDIDPTICPYEGCGCCILVVDQVVGYSGLLLGETTNQIINSYESIGCEVSSFIQKKDFRGFVNNRLCLETKLVQSQNRMDPSTLEVCVKLESEKDYQKRYNDQQKKNNNKIYEMYSNYNECFYCESSGDNNGIEAAEYSAEIIFSHGTNPNQFDLFGVWYVSDDFQSRMDFWSYWYRKVNVCDHFTFEMGCLSGKSVNAMKVLENKGPIPKDLYKIEENFQPVKKDYETYEDFYDRQRRILLQLIEDGEKNINIVEHNSEFHLGQRSNINLATSRADRLTMSCFSTLFGSIENIGDTFETLINNAKDNENKINEEFCKELSILRYLNGLARSHYINNGYSEEARGCNEDNNECWCRPSEFEKGI